VPTTTPQAGRSPSARRLHDARLQRRRQRGDRRAGAELAERYLPMARKLALRYRATGEPLDDLVQVASVGLVMAMTRWDPDRGVAFSTFAVPTILGELRRYFRDSTWAVRPPRAKQELSMIVAKAREQLSHQGTRSAGVAEIAGLVGRSPDEVRDALEAAAARRADSLDEPVGEGGGEEALTGLDMLGQPDAGYERVETEVALDGLTATLDERAREVVRLRYREDLYQREIGERVGVSQMQVSRILRDSLRRLQL
jgi:RNA polymerase sigma-B factor